MADPITIVQVVSASASLAMQCAQVAKGLHDLAGKYKTAEISIRSTANELDIIRLAWDRIQTVLQSWEGSDDSDPDLLTELRLKLQFGQLVVSSLADDLGAFTNRPFSFIQRSKYVWNEGNFKGHQDRVRGQVAAMNLLVSVLNLPTTPARIDMLQKGASILRKSDESALSIVPSRLSSRLPSIISNDSQLSLESAELVYHQLSIDDDLFTSRTYKRNYRHSLMFFKMMNRKPVLQRQSLGHSGSSIHTIDLDHPDPDLHDLRRQPINSLKHPSSLSKDMSKHLLDGHGTNARLLKQLELAVDVGSPTLVRLLCDSGASLDVAKGVGSTVVEQACMGGWPKALEALISYRPNQVDLQPSHLFDAARNLHPDTVEVLLKHRLDVNAKDPISGMTSLHLVVRAIVERRCRCSIGSPCRGFRTAKILLEYGAELDAQDHCGENIYHYVARSTFRGFTYLRCLKPILDVLSQGSNYLLQTWNSEGMTPVEVAFRRGDSKIRLLFTLMLRPEQTDHEAPKDAGQIWRCYREEISLL